MQAGRPALRALLVVAAVAACHGNSVGIQLPPGPAPAPAVRVQGNRLVDTAGRPVRLRGVNRSGAEYACAQGWGIFDGPSDSASVQAIASWRANVVRLPLNETCWLGINGVAAAYAGANYQRAIADYVGTLNRAGLTIVLVTHEPDIATYASRHLTFRDGRLRADERVEAPVDAAVALASLPREDEDAA